MEIIKTVAKTITAIALFVTLAGPISPQEDSPQIEKCRADLSDWTQGFSFTGGDTTRSDMILTYDQLKDRTAEANRCGLMDPMEPYHTATVFLQTRYNGLMKDRLFDFIVRHQMIGQFEQDDKNGLR